MINSTTFVRTLIVALLLSASASAEDLDTATTLISKDVAFSSWMIGDNKSFTKPEPSMRHLVNIDLPRNQEEAQTVNSINLTLGLHGAFDNPKPGVEVVVAW